MGFNKPQGRQGAAEAATGIAPLKKYISQKAGSIEDQNRGVSKKKQKQKAKGQKKDPAKSQVSLLFHSISAGPYLPSR